MPSGSNLRTTETSGHNPSRKTMKRTLFTLMAMAVTLMAAAQSAYISASPMQSADRNGDLGGAGGVLIVSDRSDLAITVVNAAEATITPKGKVAGGAYEYEVVVDRKQTTQPKIEVNRRGDVNRCSFTVMTRPDYFRAYKVEEVEKPISLEDATAGNDAILDSTLVEVVFASPIADLKVDCDLLRSKGVEVKTSTSRADRSITEKTLTIPIRIIRDAKHEMEVAAAALAEKQHQLLDDPKAQKKAKESDWAELDELERKAEETATDFAQLTTISVYAPGTNRMTVDISDLKPRMKKRYSVLVLKVIEEKHVSVCSGMLAEGARLYGIREYDNAKAAFQKALTAKDTPAELKRTIQTNMAQCDSCKLYERYATAALTALKKVREQGEGTQADVVRYASAAIEFMDKLNMYNPCDFYSERIGRLNKIIEDQPLEIHFTFVQWVSNPGGFYEGDLLSNVEVWAYDGEQPPVAADYRDEKRITKLLNAGGYSRVGVSDVRGLLDIRFDRKALPKGLFFRPVGYGTRVRADYMDMREVMQRSEGDYQKRQFRTKMYTMLFGQKK